MRRERAVTLGGVDAGGGCVRHAGHADRGVRLRGGAAAREIRVRAEASHRRAAARRGGVARLAVVAPAANTLKLALCPSATVCGAGWVVMTGATACTVSTATALMRTCLASFCTDIECGSKRQQNENSASVFQQPAVSGIQTGDLHLPAQHDAAQVVNMRFRRPTIGTELLHALRRLPTVAHRKHDLVPALAQ